MKVITLKIGGKFSEQEDLLRMLAGDIRQLVKRFSFILVHGGGCEVSRISRMLGIEPVFRDGIRITSPEEMDIVEMILSGMVNKRLVRLLQSSGINAVGLCGSDGSLFTGNSLDYKENTSTGEIRKVDSTLLQTLFKNGYFPVISSTSMDRNGLGLNINADTVAFEIACALKSAGLLFLSDIPGIMKQGQLLRCLNEEEINEELSAGTISGGMIPKVTSSLKALKHGVGWICIGQYCSKGDLVRLLEGDQGTRIRRLNHE